MNPNSLASRLFWSVPILSTIIFSMLTIISKIDQSHDQLKDIVYIVGTFLLVVVIVITIAYPYLITLIENWSFKLQRIYSDFIYQSIRSRLEYLEVDGSLVAYERVDHVTKLSLKKEKSVINVPFEAVGEIIKDSIDSIHGTYHMPSIKNVIFNCSFDKRFVLDKEHIVSYSFIMKNSFKGNQEFWVINAKKYCKYYYLNIFLPKERNLLNAQIFYTKKDKEDEGNLKVLDNSYNNWIRVNEPFLMKKARRNYTVLSVTITSMKPTDIYKIVWTLT